MGELMEQYFEKTYIAPNETTQQWINRILRLAKELQNECHMSLPEPLQVHYLLRGMRLTRPQRAQIMAAASSQYAWGPITTAISVMYPSTIPRVTDHKAPHQNRPQQRPQQGKGSGSKGSTTVKTKTVFATEQAEDALQEEQAQEEEQA